MKASIEWTPERVKKLKELWDQGYSAAQISNAFGHAVSRNAVLGKVRRLSLPARATTFATSRIKAQTAPATTPKPRPAIAKEKPEPVTFIGPLERFPPAGTFQYTPDDVLRPNWQMCGNPVAKLGTSWCSAHASICFDPPRTEASRKKFEAAPDKAEAA